MTDSCAYTTLHRENYDTITYHDLTAFIFLNIFYLINYTDDFLNNKFCFDKP